MFADSWRLSCEVFGSVDETSHGHIAWKSLKDHGSETVFTEKTDCSTIICCRLMTSLKILDTRLLLI